MNTDVQGWLDSPSTNFGWRISSSTEGAAAQIQRFASTEAGSSIPSLAITYTCKPGFSAIGNACVHISLDIDDNQAYDALTDGALIVRYLLGLSDEALTAGAIGPNSARNSPVTVKQYLDDIHQQLDIDGDLQVDAMTDGLLLMRYLFGFRGQALIDNARAQNAPRDAAAIESYIQSLMPP